MSASPTSRSLAYLRANLYQAKVVEKWNAHARIRQDLWGADIIACRAVPEPEILLVQTTTKKNMAARERKLRDLTEVWGWIRSGGKFEIHGWDGTEITVRPLRG